MRCVALSRKVMYCSDMHFQILMTPEQLRNQLMSVKTQASLVVMLVDLLDASGSFLGDYPSHRPCRINTLYSCCGPAIRTYFISTRSLEILSQTAPPPQPNHIRTDRHKCFPGFISSFCGRHHQGSRWQEPSGSDRHQSRPPAEGVRKSLAVQNTLE